MALLVVPLAAEDTPMLTIEEWDRLVACERVLFEHSAHPLLDRLRSAGVAAGPFDDEPHADRQGWALVTEPTSSRIVELAKEGAEVLLGPAQTPDELTAARGAYVVRRAAASLSSLAAVMARLRSPEGCPWDREQTHESLRVHLVEEAYEVLDAIDREELGPGLEEELGDVLLQVVFHSELAAGDERFDVADVADRLVTKLVHRHPHVFGDAAVADAGEVVRNWETIKAAEKERGGPFDGIPGGLPSLLYAYKVQKRAASLGFAADAQQARRELEGALAAVADAATPQGEPGPAAGLGEALFWLVALARAEGVDPEGALRAAVTRFRDRAESGNASAG